MRQHSSSYPTQYETLKENECKKSVFTRAAISFLVVQPPQSRPPIYAARSWLTLTWESLSLESVQCHSLSSAFVDES